MEKKYKTTKIKMTKRKLLVVKSVLPLKSVLLQLIFPTMLMH